jgi:16S rRNA (cytosine1402-N4)-methyltransferase
LSALPCKKHFIHNNFASLPDVLNQMNITAVDGVLLDLGWSSFQISDATRGLSFTHDGPLDMNLSKGLSGDRLTAYEIINQWEEKTLADIFYAYGDEVKARVIARCIVQERNTKPIETTHELANCVIKALYPKRYGQEKPIYFKSHPATKVFQALRIAVNDEFAVLESFYS